METILKEIYDEPVDLIYLGIGSAPNTVIGNKIEPKYDQLIPTCFHEPILKDKKQIRILHFDPLFDTMKGFLDSYFETWKLVSVEFEGGYKWIGETLEVYILPKSIYHKEDFCFFESLTNLVLNTKGKLVVQEYTGYSLQELNRKLHDVCAQKEKYKRRILFDMTYGTDLGCCTDMTVAQPFYDYDGNFLNLHFATSQDVKRWVRISLKLDDVVRRLYTAKYLMTLNHYHVDYRRRLRGEKGLYESDEYNDVSTPDDIMKVLQKNLRDSFELLVLVRGIKKEYARNLEELLVNYKLYDPYKWYDLVSKLIQ